MKRSIVCALAMSAFALACDKKPSDGAAGAASGSAASAPAAAGATGIQECDDYIAKISACMSKDPKLKEEAEAQFKAQVDGWKQGAAHDKDATRALCKTALQFVGTTYPSCK
jgi:hypothetical protein